MSYIEKISWRVDNIDKTDEYQNAIDFVHSFGKKCDCVGWCNMELKGDKDLALLDEIKALAKAKKGKIRGIYEKSLVDKDTEWYAIFPSKTCGYEIEDELIGVKAYSLSPKDDIAQIDNNEMFIVTQRFVDVCKENNFTGVDFAFVRDIGKYEAPSHFLLIPTSYVEKATLSTIHFETFAETFKPLRKKRVKQADYYGGSLTKVDELFDELMYASLPIMIDKNNQPKTDFSYVALDSRPDYILVRRDTAKVLVANYLLKKNELVPVEYFDENEHSSLIKKCGKAHFVPKETLNLWAQNREKYETRVRPKYMPTEKSALKLLRKAKKERAEDFEKPLSKALVDMVDDVLIKSILSVYKVSNGGYVNDEIWLLPYIEIAQKTKSFLEDIKNEEPAFDFIPLLSTARVIGVANGDMLLLLEDESVLIYCHDDFTLSESYENMWYFLFSNLE